MTSPKTITTTEGTANPIAHDGALTSKQAQIILQFLQRTQLQGAEMAAYVDAFNALSVIAKASSADEAFA
ncbi:hypothetical protein [Kordiimonas aquimaris]|uniref:hypothetical protein n=1 Tax=Kordiimonas aquimaris TaxID=707591 RepID=UPI0021D194E6|nr:hypothetical protein [Kordiimonas aquimaris]